ncbi:hypothetical protein T06_8812, partial [Trichinella sp. T6]
LLLQLSGEKVSVLSYICHNSGGQLLKKRQSEMWLTARLFRPRLSCTVARRGVRSRKRYKYKCGGRREQHQKNTRIIRNTPYRIPPEPSPAVIDIL